METPTNKKAHYSGLEFQGLAAGEHHAHARPPDPPPPPPALSLLTLYSPALSPGTRSRFKSVRAGLSVSSFKVTDRSVQAVAEHCPELQFVGFMGCPVTSQGVIHLTGVSGVMIE
ncbi:hypothetical protein NHX12_029113 [Muraenolepis orangiensis]|uniref:Uncharacterized protein n=1 Tax=Muraenolepis orangiensis TaxID=630683 RepID=A0A9Q0EAK8_9TELE|nr:hypothetical protein NHX12_029113 [Muraenolepis orangiensis]